MKKILLVSSSNGFLERNRNLLKRTDFRIFTATNAEDALRLQREELIDLIVAELHMTDPEGDDLIDRIRAESGGRNISIILTCLDTPHDLARASRSGANAWITRPVQPVMLLNLVGQFLTVPMIRSIRVLLDVEVMSRMDGREFSCVSRNVSATGILLETARHLAKDDRIVCTFTVPGFGRVEVEGEVVRSVTSLVGGHQYGVRFLDLSPDFRRGIEKYVTIVAQREGIPAAYATSAVPSA